MPEGVFGLRLQRVTRLLFLGSGSLGQCSGSTKTSKDYGNVRYLAQQLLDTVPQAGPSKTAQCIYSCT